jgi:hypothetical protein
MSTAHDRSKHHGGHHGGEQSTPVGLRKHRLIFGIGIALALLALAVFVITNFESILPSADVPPADRQPAPANPN